MKRYKMATVAIHQLGDISRDEPDLCIIDDETDTDYIGRWVEGFGFFNVRFPKHSTRELSPTEREHYDGSVLVLNGTPLGTLQIEEVG